MAEELYFILEGAGEMELDGGGIAQGPARRCDPHPARRVAHHRGYRTTSLSLLLRAALLARGYVFHVIVSEDGRLSSAEDSDKSRAGSRTLQPFSWLLGFQIRFSRSAIFKRKNLTPYSIRRF